MRRLRFGAALRAAPPSLAVALSGALTLSIALAAGSPAPAFAQSPAVHGARPDGVAMVSVLGRHAPLTFAPVSRQVGALVALPKGRTAAELGLELVAPGIARFRGSPAALARFGASHPEINVEVSPPLHMLLDRAGTWVRAPMARTAKGIDGEGTLVGLADTGIDVTHPDLLDANGKSRVAWLLDLSLAPFGKHRELEEQFGVKDSDGTLVAGAVLTGADIDDLIAARKRTPGDEIGHGTHVTSLAVGNGGGSAAGPYVGVAPKAGILFARVTRSGGESIENDDLLRGAAFMFDRASAMNRPVAVNLSIGTDFGPHDGSMLWEQTLASFVGPEHPGRALVVAAGNSGSIADSPIHQNVHVAAGGRTRVPIIAKGASAGGVQVWVSIRPGADLKIGLEGPDGEWISPVSEGEQRGKNGAKGTYNAGVIYGSKSEGSPVPPSSRGAVVLWSGGWPGGTYNITFEGTGTVDLFFQATGDAGRSGVGFVAGVREGTINLPGTHPGIIAVGCTLNHPKWKSIAQGTVGLQAPLLDIASGLPAGSGGSRSVAEGEVCWFSSTGPTVTGVPKPEISAPGAGVIGALAKQAAPGSPGSIFSNPSCPPVSPGGAADPRCLQIDATHGVAVGTSMSAPMVSGAIALLFQRDPTLTQDKIVALLQAGAHRMTGTPYEDHGGPGELDVVGSMDALDALQNPALQLPSLDKSWITLSSTFAAADGSTPIVAIVELRTADGEHRADMFEPERLRPVVRFAGTPAETLPQLIRKGPGLYYFTIAVPAGKGGSALTVGATFDGVDVVTPKVIPVATDAWTADYPSSVHGGACSITPWSAGARSGLAALGGVGVAALIARRRRR